MEHPGIDQAVRQAKKWTRRAVVILSQNKETIDQLARRKRRNKKAVLKDIRLDTLASSPTATGFRNVMRSLPCSKARETCNKAHFHKVQAYECSHFTTQQMFNNLTSQLEGLKARLEQHLLQRQHNHLGGHNQLGCLAEGKTKQPHYQSESSGKQRYMLGSAKVL